MRHQRKGSIIEHVEHPITTRTSVIRLDKRTMWFFARENDADLTQAPFESKDGAEVKQWLLKQLAYTTDASNLDWTPVAKIDYGGETRMRYRNETQVHGESLKIEVVRFYLALTKDKREWRQLPWEACDPESAAVMEPKDRYAASKEFGPGPLSPRLKDGYTKAFTLPSFRDAYRNPETILLYTPELWAGLLAVVQAIKAARDTLNNMMSTKKGIAAVAEIGTGKQQLLLNPGKTP